MSNYKQAILALQSQATLNDLELAILAELSLTDFQHYMQNNTNLNEVYSFLLENIDQLTHKNNKIIPIKGKYTNAKIFTKNADQSTIDQVQKMLNHKITENTQVRIMPDCHIGKGSTIGTTIRLGDNKNNWKISPNVVGVDIGCGMLSYQLKNTSINLKKLNQIVQQNIPSGFNIHPRQYRTKSHQNIQHKLNQLTFNLGGKAHQRIMQSIGTLGGGNHFIELSQDETGSHWLTVHSGSRNLGVRVASYHQKLAENNKQKRDDQLAYLKGPQLENYLHDAQIAQDYAKVNRQEILDKIVSIMDFTVVDSFDSIHNFVDINHQIIRKGATSAQKGERLLIPLNMRDGSIIAIGKGNADWNFSAPHGAGRILSRSQARKQLDIKHFKEEMKNVYTTSVNQKTIDEAPMAYKQKEEILENIDDTVHILHYLKPIYNFKAN